MWVHIVVTRWARGSSTIFVQISDFFPIGIWSTSYPGQEDELSEPFCVLLWLLGEPLRCSLIRPSPRSPPRLPSSPRTPPPVVRPHPTLSSRLFLLGALHSFCFKPALAMCNKSSYKCISSGPAAFFTLCKDCIILPILAGLQRYDSYPGPIKYVMISICFFKPNTTWNKLFYNFLCLNWLKFMKSGQGRFTNGTIAGLESWWTIWTFHTGGSDHLNRLHQTIWKKSWWLIWTVYTTQYERSLAGLH